MRFEKTAYGWKSYRKAGRAYIYFGHFLTQRAARAALAQSKGEA